jgi:hypothetical protein
MDLGTFAPATTTAWFDAQSPTRLIQYAAFGETTYEITSALKANVACGTTATTIASAR